ncbi:MAG: VanZ family protein [Bacteroidota bacterium]
MKKLRPSVLPALLWLIISTVLLTLPGSAFPKDDWFSKIWFDKWVHIGLFALLVFLWCWSLLSHKMDISKLKRGFMTIALLAFAYGIGMEFVQKHFVVNRFFDKGDILADAGGCTLGWLFSYRRYIKK